MAHLDPKHKAGLDLGDDESTETPEEETAEGSEGEVMAADFLKAVESKDPSAVWESLESIFDYINSKSSTEGSPEESEPSSSIKVLKGKPI